MRRSWLRGLVNVSKRYLIADVAHNLGRILFQLLGIGKPRALQAEGGLAALAQLLRDWLPRLVWLICWPVQPARRPAA